MTHHNPRHPHLPHRHHVRPKKAAAPVPMAVETPDNGYKGLFWLIVLGTAAVIGLGYCLSQPPLPPPHDYIMPPAVFNHDPAPEIQEYAPAPPLPDFGARPDHPVIPAAEPVKPHKAKTEETEKHRHKADDDEPKRHKRRHHHDD